MKRTGRIGLVLLLVGCRQAEPPPPPPLTVTVENPRVERITEWNEYSGQLRAVEQVEVRPRVSGYVDSIHFKEGQKVAEGDLLFVIDKRPFEAEVAQARAGVSQALATQALARANLGRARQLTESEAISRQETDVRVSEAQQADADVEQARAELDAAELQLEYTDIRAPIAGIAGRHLVTRGNLVQGGAASSTLLTTIVPHDPIYVYFETDEAAVLSAIRRYFEGRSPGRGEEGPRPIEMQLADETGFPHKGEIDYFDNQLDPATNTLEVRGKFANPDDFFTPGMFARVRTPAGREEDAILIPEAAIGSDLTARFVWVVGADGIVERRQVELGGRHGDRRVVRKGLATEDVVVVEGIQMLRPGTKVVAEHRAPETPEPAPDGQSSRPSQDG